MPLLTDITMDELLLTDAICADFSHLPLLRRLRGVRWPIDIDPPDSHERMTTNDPRAKHFPSLVSLHITSEAMVESRLWTPSTMKKRACGRRFQGVFPHYDLYQFVRSLPKKLEELDIRLGTAWSFDLTTIRCCLDTLVAREPEERRLDEQYLAILQRMSARTDIADGIRTRSDGVRVPMQEPYQPAEFTREERWQSITAMEVYQDRSFEELRLVDYDRHADILSGEVPLFPDPNRDVGPPAWRPAELGDLLEKWIEARDRSRQVHQPWERPLR